MANIDTIDLLRSLDPARMLAPADAGAREELRVRIVGAGPGSATGARPRRRPVALAAAAGTLALVVGAGAAWASGALSPIALFRANAAYDDPGAGHLWHQRVVPGSVTQAASLHIPRVGRVQFWFGR